MNWRNGLIEIILKSTLHVFRLNHNINFRFFATKGNKVTLIVF